MYSTILQWHSIVRYLFLAILLCSIVSAYIGWRRDLLFSKSIYALRHWTATIGHIQLVLGVLLYSQSPLIKNYWSQGSERTTYFDGTFFAIIHAVLMLFAILLLTIGSAKAKRAKLDKSKYGLMLVYFMIALVIIFVAIPWPFSPLAQRAYYY